MPKRLNALRIKEGWLVNIVKTVTVASMGDVITIAEYEELTVSKEKSTKGIIIAE